MMVRQSRMNLQQISLPLLRPWLPGLIAGAIAWIAFLLIGQTPVLRASGLALIVVGMAMMLQRSGPALAVTGALALAFSPAFWSQTGSAQDPSLPMTLLALAAASVAVLVILLRFRERWMLAMIIGFAIFTLLFWTQLARIGSLRITTLCAAWLLYLLIDALYLSHPHPSDPPSAATVQSRHSYGVLILFAVGVINEPAFVMIAPALVLGLLLYKQRLPWWFWLLLLATLAFGFYSVTDEYIRSTWWSIPAAEAESRGIRVHAMFADGWREASRWLYLVNLVISQFSLLGVALGVMGLSRLSRWYPPLGGVTMLAYASFALFGLVYFGNDGPVLLLPLLMIQVFWMTYGVFALGEWLRHSLQPRHRMLRLSATLLYGLLPLFMLSRILTGV